MEQVLFINGTGSYSVTPNITTINIKFDEVLDTYKNALTKSIKDAKEIRQVFVDLGFSRTDLKTIRFDIRTKYRDEYKNSSRIEIFEGYQYNQQFKIKFKKDTNLLRMILLKLSNCISNPKFSINYEIEDKEAAREEALKLAVKDARNKAEIIALASNVELLSIISIDNLDENNRYDLLMYNSKSGMECCDECYTEDDFNLEFNPDDLVIKESVNIKWQIK